MGVDYAISRYYGFEIPQDLNEKDEILLEKLINNWSVISPRGDCLKKYIFLEETEVEIKHGRLIHFVKVKLGETIYPKTYIKEIENELNLEISEKLKSELSKLSFQPNYKYYEYARIC